MRVTTRQTDGDDDDVVVVDVDVVLHTRD